MVVPWTRYVLFSPLLAPHPRVMTQHTPKELAHDPSAVPPLAEHSSLKRESVVMYSDKVLPEDHGTS